MTTQAYKSQMQAAMTNLLAAMNVQANQAASLKLMIDNMPVDGPPVAGAGTWAEYQGPFLGGSKAYRAVAFDPATGQPVKNPDGSTILAVQYTSVTATDGLSGTAQWGTSVEHHRIKMDAPTGEKWGWVDGYEAAGTGEIYGQEVVKAEWLEASGAWRDISTICGCGPGIVAGTPAHPLQIPSSGGAKLRVWFWLHNAASAGGARNRRAYFEALFGYGQSIANPCWTTDAQTTRQVIAEREAWWDESSLWVNATSAQLPYNPDGTPRVPDDIVYQSLDYFGRGTGVIWQMTNGAWHAAMESITSIAQAQAHALAVAGPVPPR